MRELFRRLVRVAVQPVLRVVDRVSGADRAATQTTRIHWGPSTDEARAARAPAPGRGLAGWCKHGVQMLNDCPRCCPPGGGR